MRMPLILESFINWIRVQHKAHNNPISDPELRDELADPNACNLNVRNMTAKKLN